MLGIALASTSDNYHKVCSQEINNHFTGKSRLPLYTQASSINTCAPKQINQSNKEPLPGIH